MTLRPFSLLTLGFLLVFSGCAGPFPANKIDPAGNLTREDYLALRNRDVHGDSKDDGTNDIFTAPPPSAAPALPVSREARAPLPENKSRNVTLSVTDSIPLRDVLMELGREADVNLELDPRITGGIIFTARDQPYDVVLRRICALAGLRHSAEEGFVRIELDEPYQKSYSLDHLSLIRKASSEVAIATNVFDVAVSDRSKNSGGAADTGNNNSTARISSATETDFWSEVAKTLPHVLSSSAPRRVEATDGKDLVKHNFSVDRQAGIVTVFGSSLQHDAVKNYLEKLEKKTSAQVLIEARIIEVELNDEFKSGVNWNALVRNSTALAATFGAPGASGLLSGADSGVFSATVDSKDITGILNLVRTFGTTRVLSSPRLTVMNNQTAVLKVARNEVYFLTSAQYPTTLSANGLAVTGTPVFSSTPHTVPVGLVMTVQPAVSDDRNRITMTLRPTISRVVNYVSDPSIALNAASAGAETAVDSQVPVLAVREMDSVLQIQSGEVAVLGGLMQDSSENQDQGVPFLDTLPGIGNFAKSRRNDGNVSELVILLRATILDNPAPDAADRDLYRRYNKDPRPLLPPQQEKEKT